ncbi:helix-turn-helix domain-containing protein [Streptomyces sp. NPDC020883]|uniref:helix-turn-helix domain-containing protein n=1 Tax=Streptomyces sp. NPDC020883 TaxID=3365099 RepID=UPI0037A74DED
MVDDSSVPSPSDALTAWLQAVGLRVRAARDHAGLPQGELARRAGMSRDYETDIEAGRRNFTMGKLIGLARTLNTPASWLIADAESGTKAGEMLRPGWYFDIPISVWDNEDAFTPRGLITCRIRDLATELLGHLVPHDWDEPTISNYLASHLESAGRIPPGHQLGWSEEPDVRRGVMPYGIWPD